MHAIRPARRIMKKAYGGPTPRWRRCDVASAHAGKRFAGSQAAGSCPAPALKSATRGPRAGTGRASGARYRAPRRACGTATLPPAESAREGTPAGTAVAATLCRVLRAA